MPTSRLGKVLTTISTFYMEKKGGDMQYRKAEESNLLVVVVDEVVWQAEDLVAQSLAHFGETFRFDQVVEWEVWEHGAISVDVCLDKETSAPDTV